MSVRLLSCGLDSSILLGFTHAVQGPARDVKAFTFVTGDPRYDELPWVQQMLAHPSIVSPLAPREVPELAASVQYHQDEPFGGIATLAYARLFERARQEGVIVLLDGQGMDEQWAGYDYYRLERDDLRQGSATGPAQGSQDPSTRPNCLTFEFRGHAAPLTSPTPPFADALRNRQYLDVHYTKIPRALRFNDRISMRSSTELREPFLDHRLVELALRQPADRKVANGTGKSLLRRMVRPVLPPDLVEAPKRPLQTPQREWLRKDLQDWARACIERALTAFGGAWLDRKAVQREWELYCCGASDNSFYVWQWVNLGLWEEFALGRAWPQRDSLSMVARRPPPFVPGGATSPSRVPSP